MDEKTRTRPDGRASLPPTPVIYYTEATIEDEGQRVKLILRFRFRSGPGVAAAGAGH
jgi:hypothetical protein